MTISPELWKQSSERLVQTGCTEEEAKLILQYASSCPPRGASPEESVISLCLALSTNPQIKEGILFMAEGPVREQERIRDLTQLELQLVPMANRFFPDPQAGTDLFYTLKEHIQKLWPEASEPRVNGAMVVSFRETPGVGWSFSAENCARIMRETEIGQATNGR